MLLDFVTSQMSKDIPLNVIQYIISNRLYDVLPLGRGLPFIIKTFIWLFIMFSPTRQAISGRRPESLALRWLTAFCIR